MRIPAFLPLQSLFTLTSLLRSWTAHVAIGGVVAVGCLGLGGCAAARITVDTPARPQPLLRPKTIYIAEFRLPLDRIKDDQVIAQTPAAVAARLVNDMADDLVDKLKDEQFEAVRLLPGAFIPSEGWLISGEFTLVDEGNRLGRAVGWGLGKTTVDATVSIELLSGTQRTTLLTVKSTANSGHMPTLGPIGAAAKLALSETELGKNVKHTAAKVADAVAAQFVSPETVASR